jgi:hypothetical protein
VNGLQKAPARPPKRQISQLNNGQNWTKRTNDGSFEPSLHLKGASLVLFARLLRLLGAPLVLLGATLHLFTRTMRLFTGRLRLKGGTVVIKGAMMRVLGVLHWFGQPYWNS